MKITIMKGELREVPDNINFINIPELKDGFIIDFNCKQYSIHSLFFKNEAGRHIEKRYVIVDEFLDHLVTNRLNNYDTKIAEAKNNYDGKIALLNIRINYIESLNFWKRLIFLFTGKIK